VSGGPVHVWLAVGTDNVKVGQLYGHRRRGTESATFQYEPSYLARPGAYAVDPMLPLASGAFQTPVELGDPLTVAARVEHDDAGADAVRRMVQAGGSLGGARPKAHVRDGDGSLAIAKFPSARTDTWEVMAWEYVLLELAQQAGIRVPDARLETIGSQYVLIVKRFDREPTTQERVGYASALTMLEAREGAQHSYLDLVLSVADFFRLAPHEAHQQLAAARAAVGGWSRVAAAVGLDRAEISRMRSAFDHPGSGDAV